MLFTSKVFVFEHKQCRFHTYFKDNTDENKIYPERCLQDMSNVICAQQGPRDWNPSALVAVISITA